MITGYNTDIEFKGTVYHVQTEDKGLDTPFLLTLVYTGGAILASKRAPYDDLVAEGFDEKVLQARLDKQHRLFCGAIKGGRINDIIEMSGKKAAAKQAEKSAAKQSEKSVAKQAEKSKAEEAQTPKPVTLPAQIPPVKPVSSPAQVKPPIAQPTAKPIIPANAKTENEGLLEIPDDLEIPLNLEEIAEIVEFDPQAVRVVTQVKEYAPKPIIVEPILFEPVKSAKEAGIVSFEPKKEEAKKLQNFETDEEFLFTFSPRNEVGRSDTQAGKTPNTLPENLTAKKSEAIGGLDIFSENLTESLTVRLLEEQEFRGGERSALRVRVIMGGKSPTVVVGAEVMVKVLGSAFRPLIFHAKSDANGMCLIHLQLPHFKTGRAAILIRATFGNAEAELRRIVTQG